MLRVLPPPPVLQTQVFSTQSHIACPLKPTAQIHLAPARGHYSVMLHLEPIQLQ